MKTPKTYTVSEALLKAASYCAYQERTQQEVREKLFSYGLNPEEVEDLIVRLCAEKMIDEERFAAAYVRGKYGIKKWGRRKILQGLKGKRISDYCIKKGMQEIDPEVYWQNLLNLLEKKHYCKIHCSKSYYGKSCNCKIHCSKSYYGKSCNC